MLVADNDRDMCQVISDIFKEQGEEVTTAYNGESALKKLKRGKYDVMILDYKFAGMSGLTVLEKAKEASPSTIAIMISGYGNESVRARAKELGAYAFLDKPFNIDRLVRLVQRAQASHVQVERG